MRYTNFWTEDRVRILTELYPKESSKYIANFIGVSDSAVRDMANSLGLKKKFLYQDSELAANIAMLLPDNSLLEISRITGLSVSSVRKIISINNLKKTKLQRSETRSRILKDVWQQERMRISWMVPRQTKYTIGVNLRKTRMRKKLRELGYVCARNASDIFYSDSTNRCEKCENDAASMGLNFYKVSV